jgi:hypothetical protein
MSVVTLTAHVCLSRVLAEAEAAYNLGRAAHRIGLLHVAVAHYERVLQLADELDAAAAADGAAKQLQGLSVEQPAPQQQQQGGDDMQVNTWQQFLRHAHSLF